MKPLPSFRRCWQKERSRGSPRETQTKPEWFMSGQSGTTAPPCPQRAGGEISSVFVLGELVLQSSEDAWAGGRSEPFPLPPSFPLAHSSLSIPTEQTVGSHPERLQHYSKYLSLFPVGLSAQIPQKAAGKRRLPPTSVPKPRMDPPPPISAPSPPEEPPGVLV